VALCTAAQALGIESLRPAMFAVVVARSLAALAGRSHVAEDDVREAAALVLGPKATQMPTPPDESPDASEPESGRDQPPEPEQQSTSEPRALDDVVLEAAEAAIPADLLARLMLGASAASSATSRSGKAGASQAGLQRGRVIGSRAGAPRHGARLDVLATLRAAAPFQRLRQPGPHAPTPGETRIAVRRDDFRIKRFRERRCTTTIFLVDASGSAALQRLAEAKGAVRLLLADCYIRRDEVALIAFRGRAAELVLPPTRALARAERALAALPGGGGTPVAAGLDLACVLADSEQRQGRTPTLVMLTDGRANVARDGAGGRTKAQEDARSAARAWRARGAMALLIDTSATPHPLAADLAAEMAARYLPLPYADAHAVNDAVKRAQAGLS
jgi:magnesium chelatase subunit D